MQSACWGRRTAAPRSGQRHLVAPRSMDAGSTFSNTQRLKRSAAGNLLPTISRSMSGSLMIRVSWVPSRV